MKNKVIDYVTMNDATRILGLARSSSSQLSRWIKDGKIQGTFSFGRSVAIPVSWVKSECLERGISWQGVELKEGEEGVNLKDYLDISEWAELNNLTYSKVYNDIVNGRRRDYIKFGVSYGLPK